MNSNPTLQPTRGLSSGEVIQFAEGRWGEAIGEGVALSEPTFDLVEPFLQAICAEWIPEHRYGVFELPPGCATKLAEALEREACVVADQDKKAFFQRLSEWLDQRDAAGSVVSVLGL